MKQSVRKEIINMVRRTKNAQRNLSRLKERDVNRALRLMGKLLKENKSFIKKENKKDINLAQKEKKSVAFIDRLTLNDKRIKGMVSSLEAIADLKSPVGQVISQRRRPNGLLIKKVRIPIGVIGIIYEARPNVTSDCVGLCLKSFNGLILRGGSLSLYSNLAISKILKKALGRTGIPVDVFNYISTPSRDAVKIMLQDTVGLIDVVIPRGGESLISLVERLSRIPVIKHYKGICHVYVDKDADISMAEKIVFNAKVQRPGVCNAMETLLVHRSIASRFLPLIYRRFKEAGVVMKGCHLTRKIIPAIKKALEKDWSTEYLDLIVSIKVVKDVSEAIEHINTYGSGHSDSIVTRNKSRALQFLGEVDSCAVYHNVSTRFTDGYEFGMGAEMGISTDKIHARGPMALEELTIYKYLVFGKGQIRT